LLSKLKTPAASSKLKDNDTVSPFQQTARKGDSTAAKGFLFGQSKLGEADTADSSKTKVDSFIKPPSSLKKDAVKIQVNIKEGDNAGRKSEPGLFGGQT